MIGHRTHRGVVSLIVAAPCVLLMPAGRAQAQVIARDFPASLPGYETDLTLPLAVDDPMVARSDGIEVGDFNIKPSAEEDFGYNSNPLGNGAGGSAVAETNAALGINSDWTRDALSGSLSVDNQQFLSLPIASQTNWVAAAGGAIDFLGSRWDFGYSHLNENLGPQQLGTLGVTAPVPYADDDVRFDDDMVFGRIRLVPALEYSSLGFGQTAGPGDYASLDRQTVSGTATGLYEWSKGNSLVVLVRDTSTQYRAQAGGNPNAGYNDVLGFVGADLQADAVIRLRALVGGETRRFGSPLGSSTTTPAAELDVIWQPTRLTQVTASLSRRLEDAASLQSSSATVTDGRIEIDHSLRADVALIAYADVGTSDFTAIMSAPAFHQTEEFFGANAVWTIRRHVQLLASYVYSTNLDSGGAVPLGAAVGLSSTANVVTLGLRLSL